MMKNTNRLSKMSINFILSFLKNNSGSIVIAFAIMFPALLLCFGFSINNAHNLKTKAKISEATNEASLAIIAINNKNQNQDAINANKQLASTYVNYYLTGKTQNSKDSSQINIDYDDNNQAYYVYYQNDFKNLFDHLNQESKPDTAIGSTYETYGNTRKDDVFTSVDIGFIADFSGSITCKYSDTHCNEYNSVSTGKNRLEYMRLAISKVISQFKGNTSIKFAFIPYDIGVPVKNNKKNPAKTDSYDCSILYKLKAPYASLDYDFWANKNILYGQWSSMKQQGLIKDYETYPYFDSNSNSIYYSLDYYRYYYYSTIVGPSLGYTSDYALIQNSLCKKQEYVDSTNLARFKYSCGINEPDYPLSTENKKRIETQYAAMVQLYDYMYSGDYDTHYSLANTQTVDIPATLKTLFSHMKENTITFTRPIAPAMSEFTPFMAMCASPIYSNKMMVGGDEKLTKNEIWQNATKSIKKFKSSPHLIGFDPDKNNSAELSAFLNDNEWQPGGGTDTISALLRSVPEFASGEGNHKIMIIISDGKDDSGADTLRDQFLEQGACQTITAGLTSASNEENGFINRAADTASIYYIKLSPTNAKLETDLDYTNEFGKWYTHCMNKNKKYLNVATDYQSLIDVTQYIIKTETGAFIKH